MSDWVRDGDGEGLEYCRVVVGVGAVVGGGGCCCVCYGLKNKVIGCREVKEFSGSRGS